MVNGVGSLCSGSVLLRLVVCCLFRGPVEESKECTDSESSVSVYVNCREEAAGTETSDGTNAVEFEVGVEASSMESCTGSSSICDNQASLSPFLGFVARHRSNRLSPGDAGVDIIL